MMKKKPELLVPAGDMEKLKMAVLYGADAVYLAGSSFGMRAFAGNFTPEELPKAVRFAHDHGVAVHATVNTMPRWNEAEKLPAYLEQLDDAGVEKLIAALGGRENICTVDNCFTRLRVTVQDAAFVREQALRELPCSGVVQNGCNVQIVYGIRAPQVRQAVEQRLDRVVC